VKAERGTWQVRLAAAAQFDYDEILLWTLEQFGERQALAYAEIIDDAFEALRDGPSLVGVRARDDIAPGLFSLHVARKKRRGRHFVLFRVERRGSARVIEVLRILHDSMDLARHFPLRSRGSTSEE
jgi:toxin ParE1/3/4